MDTKTDTLRWKVYSLVVESYCGYKPNPNKDFYCPICHPPDDSKEEALCDSCILVDVAFTGGR